MDKKNPLDVAKINPTMLTVINEASFSGWSREQYIAAGEEASKIKYFSQWVLGRLAHKYSRKWGDCSAYAREIHVEPRSLLAYRRVYRKIKEAKSDYIPDGFLTWGALQVIAEETNPVKLIEELSGKGKVTVRETIEHIARRKGQSPRPGKPRISLKFDEGTGLWEINMNEEDFEKIKWERVAEKLLAYLKEMWDR